MDNFEVDTAEETTEEAAEGLDVGEISRTY